VHTFRQREVGQRVVDVEQAVDFGIERSLRGTRRRQHGRRLAEGILLIGGGRGAHETHQREAVEHIACLDGFDGHAWRQVLLARVQRKHAPQWIDELVALGQLVAVVQPALELVAEQRAEALAVADALDETQRQTDALGGQVHLHEVGRRGRGMRQVAVAQHRGRDRVTHRRRVDVSLVGIVGQQRCGLARLLLVEDLVELFLETHRRQRARLRPHVFEPAVGAEMDALAPRRAHRGQLEIDETTRPGIEAVGAAVEMLGQRALEPRRRCAFQLADRAQLLGQVARAERDTEPVRDVCAQRLARIAGHGLRG
jgi:hypothetical protein